MGSTRWFAWSWGALVLAAGCSPASKTDSCGTDCAMTGAGGAVVAGSGGQRGMGSGGSAAGTGGIAAGTGNGGTQAGSGGAPVSGTGGMDVSGADDGGMDATDAGDAGSAGGGATCPGLPDVTDYSATGPFDTTVEMNVGPSNDYTLFRPDTSLGKDGFKHPIAVWGNGITTTPSQYAKTLTLFASHGIVLLACNDTMAEEPCLSAGLDWLVAQNASGPMAGKLDTSKEIAIGYSWGGGAALDTSVRTNIVATVSFHGMPPRQEPWAKMHAPLLLFTSTGDTFVSADGYVTPNYESSMVPTFYATLHENVSHTYIIDSGGGAEKEKGPAIAFIRLFACGDRTAKQLFFGNDCTLCKDPWSSQKKTEAFWE